MTESSIVKGIEEFFRGQWQYIIASLSMAYDAITNYMEPIIRELIAKSSPIFYFNGESFVDMGLQYTPTPITTTWNITQLRTYPLHYDKYRKHGLDLLAYVELVPTDYLTSVVPPDICENPEEDPVCIIRNIHRIMYKICTGKDAPPDAPIDELTRYLVTNNMQCVIDFTSKAEFTVRVNIDLLIALFFDVVTGVRSFVAQYGKYEPGAQLIMDARLTEAFNKLTNLSSKRVGMVYTQPPIMVLAMIKDAYFSVSTMIQSIAYSMLARAHGT